VSVQPFAGDPLRIHGAIAHREIAPGAEEFIPPTTGLWLPPERTFSPVGRAGFLPERLDHAEVGVERNFADEVIVGVRAFRQAVNDQIVTLFGMSAGAVDSTIGHYLVGSAGDFEAYGFGATVSREIGERLRAAVDYSQSDAQRTALSPSERRLSRLAPAVLRDNETIRTVTASVQSIVPVTLTHLLVMYRVSNAFADTLSEPSAAARFDVQVTQALPFMNFGGAHWEMLVAVRNVFREDLFEGSVYDELLVVRPPKRMLGGVTLKF
jgi:hypothetical protein